MYSAMIGLSISFMVLGVILAITAVFVFFKKNMAQVQRHLPVTIAVTQCHLIKMQQ